MSDNTLFIEETLPDGYRVIWRASKDNPLDFTEAFRQLEISNTSNRLELWSKAHAETSKGFAPMAFKDKGKLMISNTLKMLGLYE